jgi:hypothetical protein
MTISVTSGFLSVDFRQFYLNPFQGKRPTKMESRYESFIHYGRAHSSDVTEMHHSLHEQLSVA